MNIKLRVKEIWAVMLMLVSCLVSKITSKEDELWLFSERGTDARDNGMWMFIYVKTRHPEINAKYIITKDSEDRHRLSRWDADLINYGSLLHCILIWKAKLCISTHIYGCYPYWFRKSSKLGNKLSEFVHSKNVFLQHGITKDDISGLHYGKSKVNLFICGAKPEYEFICNKYGYPEGVVKYTGLARFDNLVKNVNKKNQILVMPTWRYWLLDEDFASSDFYLKFRDLLCNKNLHDILDKNDTTLIFYPHYEIQKYISEFKKLQLPSSIIIASKQEYDVQQLLMESSLLITDYSSVYFDFVYMNKPVLYYQFDEVRYRKEQYQDGYYDYHNGLGEWTDNLTVLLSLLEKSVISGFNVSADITKRIDEYFPVRDEYNRERIYNEIIKL